MYWVLHLLFLYLWRQDFIINDRAFVWFRALWKLKQKKNKKQNKTKKKKSYFLIVRLLQIMHLKSQKYTVDHLFVHYKNQLSEFISKKIMQIRWFYIVNFWIHLQYIFIIVIWSIFIFFSFIVFFLLQKHGKKHIWRVELQKRLQTIWHVTHLQYSFSLVFRHKTYVRSRTNIILLYIMYISPIETLKFNDLV